MAARRAERERQKRDHVSPPSKRPGADHLPRPALPELARRARGPCSRRGRSERPARERERRDDRDHEREQRRADPAPARAQARPAARTHLSAATQTRPRAPWISPQRTALAALIRRRLDGNPAPGHQLFTHRRSVYRALRLCPGISHRLGSLRAGGGSPRTEPALTVARRSGLRQRPPANAAIYQGA